MSENEIPICQPSFSVGKQPGNPTPSPIVPVQHHRVHLSKGRVAAIDLRIGLNMLGQEGRKLLAEYVAQKLQQASEKISQPEYQERNEP